MTDLREAARDVRYALEPVPLCTKLGLTERAQRQAGGLLICCPVHEERTPSCSVTRGQDGTTRCRCFACDWSADAIGLVAAVHGLPTRGPGFRETLAVAAELCGLLALSMELRGGRPSTPHVPPPKPEPLPERDYPPIDEVRALWDAGRPVFEVPDVAAYLERRAIDPARVDAERLARALPDDALPRWARFRGETWAATGHRLVLRTFDASGELRSVRTCRVVEGDTPKRLPPAGHRASGLVLANRLAVGMLLGRSRPSRLLVAEGEPDFLTLATRHTADAIVGIGSGAWSEDFAARVPAGCDVLLATHADDAGERYAATVASTLGDRCHVWRAA